MKKKKKNYLELNGCKTKEKLIDFRRCIHVSNFFVIKGVEVKRVETFKYLGVIFDNGLGWKENTNTSVKNTGLYCFPYRLTSVLRYYKCFYLLHLKCAYCFAVSAGMELSQSRTETDWMRSYRRRKVS